MPAFAAGGVISVVLIASLMSGGRDSAGAGADGTIPGSNPGEIGSELTVPATTLPIAVDTVATAEKTQLSGPITLGSSGNDVKMVQERLLELGFAPGPADGNFGSGTQQAVWAYKKLVLKISPTDLENSNNATEVSPDMWLGMQDDISIPPRRPNGAGSRHTEIYLPHQVAIVFHDDVPILIAHISSGKLDSAGKPKEFCEVGKFDTDDQGRPVDPPIEKDICALAKTPGGVFKFYRQYEGKRVSALGGMNNPVYFNFGIAVHGADNVPLHPESHGCIRINQTIASYFQDLVDIGDRVYVWGHDGKEPENYTKNESLPSFNYTNPNSTSTTSSSSTSSTVPKSTTTTTKPPVTTTTTTRPPTPTTTTTTAPPATTTTTTEPPGP